MTQRRPRYASRRDENQAQIVAELRQLPLFEVWDISTLPDSVCPGDILVWDRAYDIVRAFEIKTEDGELSEAQKKTQPFAPTVRSAEDVLQWFGRI